MEIRSGGPDDVPVIMAMLDGAVAWLASNGRLGQWGSEPWSRDPRRVERITGIARDDEILVAVVDGRPAGASSMIVPILPDYFRTMGTPILHGREFTGAELRTDARVAVVNEQFAREFGPSADAVGRRIDDGDGSRRIVGVVRDMDYMTEGANSTQVFVPSRSPGGFFSTFVVRVDGQAAEHLASVRDTIRSVDPKVPVFGVKTMEQRMEDVLARPKFYRTAVLSFAAFAFLLAVIGIYGIVSYAVAQRAREMGLRMALGSTPLRLRAILVRQGLLTVAVAAIPGVAGAILTGRYLENLVDGAKSGSAATCAACASSPSPSSARDASRRRLRSPIGASVATTMTIEPSAVALSSAPAPRAVSPNARVNGCRPSSFPTGAPTTCSTPPKLLCTSTPTVHPPSDSGRRRDDVPIPPFQPKATVPVPAPTLPSATGPLVARSSAG